MARITWKDGQYSSTYGYVGKLRLFSLAYRTRRDDPTYTLRSDLQGFTSQEWKDNDAKTLKARAERVLEAFVSELGAVFPDSSLPEKG
jgi:hypothetical protein